MTSGQSSGATGTICVGLSSSPPDDRPAGNVGDVGVVIGADDPDNAPWPAGVELAAVADVGERFPTGAGTEIPPPAFGSADATAGAVADGIVSALACGGAGRGSGVVGGSLGASAP